MFWADKIALDTETPQPSQIIVVNDSKTPSGRVHVGSLRGVVIHDVIYRALKQAGKPVKFIYGVDDYDALDTVPHYLDQEKFSPYLGFPLCNVPSPEDHAPEYAKFFMGEFLEVFDYLGIKPEIYYLRDKYRSGDINKYIDIFLTKAHLVREAYKQVSKADRPSDWLPFHPICENCGKIATTVTTDYNGKEVFYTCKPHATNYVKGCGHSGWVSPFNGNGKLPWKVEWVAKWDLVGVSIEMAGKDHSQKGGSRDVANSICRKVLAKEPPFHSPYEFILVNGTKMSSSKGVGSSAKEMASLLPPELLRFLMLRTPPKTVINFSPNYETITRLFRDYDTLIAKSSGDELEGKEKAPLIYAQLETESDQISIYRAFDISTLISLLQIPHLDIEAEIEKRSPDLNEFDWQIVRQRIAVARKWLQDYADEEEKLVLYLDQIPDRAQEITEPQKQYFHKLIQNLEATTNWDGDALQTLIFATSREVELSQKEAFQAIYFAFLGKERGPKAGSLFSYLDKSFVLKRLSDVSS
ncbi:lysyl-tRNA synthetase, class I [Synechococcus sp. PCC 7502]|uniref:lysine--tRNA ligase n=1 Tax=Synechococcus sp. PCC 7502 TaxID=1173263 RepID=UPI00029FD845|nr:lysine--tRNA ligase [Synechococcus sp. PCC 7502]AFY73078.1 lysyl-tRNA synthetase, class I [Synechococcus sp. PCC 7502]